MPEVYITRSAVFLPNEIISNDEMEDYLGYIADQPSKSKAIVLRNNGIKARYYALDKDGNPTHTNSQLAAEAVKMLFNQPAKLSEVDLLCCGTSSPDQIMPSHGLMVHGELKESGNLEVSSHAGNCCSGISALKYAFMSIKSGEYRRAVAVGSERTSIMMRKERFEEEVKKTKALENSPYLAFEKDFLRWMLSDGAGAFLVEDQPNKNKLSLKIEWIDATSFANEKEVCMYMGGDKDTQGNFKGYVDFAPQEIIEKSVLSMKQDTKLLSENIAVLGAQFFKKSIEKHGLDTEKVTYFLPHLSSMFFHQKLQDALAEQGVPLPHEKWFTNLPDIGNIGAASIYAMVDDLLKGNKLQKGNQLLLAIPESARFTYMLCLLTVC